MTKQQAIQKAKELIAAAAPSVLIVRRIGAAAFEVIEMPTDWTERRTMRDRYEYINIVK